ncbi:MAG: type 4a pilus biogenesis protein PilO [Gemmatimonadetes bacterium]|nr:type 4a pilus biogenesis protein PilO [Gemmatimonadota bacterium]
MAGLPTTQRDQIMLAVGILMLLGGGAYWYFVDEPQNVALVTKIAQLDTLNASNQRAKAQLARGTAAQIRKESDSLRANLDLLRTLVPAGNEVAGLIEQVSNAARRVKLELGGIDPQPPIEGEMFDTYRYKIKLAGSYHEVAEVLANIATLSRVVAPINLALVPNAAGNQKPGRQLLAATFDIQTYVVRTSPPKAKPAAKVAAKPEGEK